MQFITDLQANQCGLVFSLNLDKVSGMQSGHWTGTVIMKNETDMEEGRRKEIGGIV